MVRVNMLKIFILSSVLILSSCAFSSKQQSGLVGGLIGGAAGAGAGAAIGAAITNGDIAASALLGTAIGVPVGVIVGVAYAVHQQNSVLEENAENIRQNQLELSRTQRRIEEERAQIDEETRATQPDRGRGQYEYIGPSAGNVYR